jgi:hypothetical protein
MKIGFIGTSGTRISAGSNTFQRVADTFNSVANFLTVDNTKSELSIKLLSKILSKRVFIDEIPLPVGEKYRDELKRMLVNRTLI